MPMLVGIVAKVRFTPSWSAGALVTGRRLPAEFDIGVGQAVAFTTRGESPRMSRQLPAPQYRDIDRHRDLRMTSWPCRDSAPADAGAAQRRTCLFAAHLPHYLTRSSPIKGTTCHQTFFKACPLLYSFCAPFPPYRVKGPKGQGIDTKL